MSHEITARMSPRAIVICRMDWGWWTCCSYTWQVDAGCWHESFVLH
jgi:hypothetical protein